MQRSYRCFTIRSLACLAATLTIAGCPSFGTLQTARTAGTGNTQIAVEPTLEGAGWSGPPLLLPVMNLSVRHGVNETLDIGGSIGMSGIGVMGKHRFSSPDSPIIFSIAPSMSGLALGSGSTGAGLINIDLPLLIGVPIGETGSELVITPKVLHNIVFARGEMEDGGGSFSTHITLVGSSLAFAAKAGNSFWIVPEVAAGIPLYATAGAGLTLLDDEGAVSASTLLPGGYLISFGLGLLFGGP